MKLAVLVVLSCIGLSVGCIFNWNSNNCAVSVSADAACPDSQYITFYLHTRSNPTTAQVIANNNPAGTNFVASKPTKIIIHGLNGTSNYAALVSMRSEFLTNGDYNLISVDWRDLASAGTILCYPTAASNGIHVGTCTGKLITALRAAGANDIHVIGHSLGAHIAGVAGNRVSPVVNRITGLDPADWFFTSSPNNNLRPACANFVDVIHTCLNDLVTVGHVDYYLNGGFIQPGCAQTDPNMAILTCSHMRALNYFTESINTATGFYGWSCPDYTAIYGGTCSSHGGRTILMGNSASTSTRGVVQVKTNSASPFAMGRD